ncbi:hypothetical protein JCM11491_007246 [Sporobolomyces phaffii]
MTTPTSSTADRSSFGTGSPTIPSSRPQSPPPSAPAPPHLRSSSRQSSTSSLHSIKRKPVPTELDQLKQLGSELIPGRAPTDEADTKEILQGKSRTFLVLCRQA